MGRLIEVDVLKCAVALALKSAERLGGITEVVGGIGKLIVSGDCKVGESPTLHRHIRIVDRGAIKCQRAGSFGDVKRLVSNHTPGAAPLLFNCTYRFWPV